VYSAAGLGKMTMIIEWLPATGPLPPAGGLARLFKIALQQHSEISQKFTIIAEM